MLRTWRQRYRERTFIEERVATFTEADILVVSHTKSGRTWLRVMISNLYSRLFALPSDVLIDGANFHALNSAVPRYFFCSDTCFPFEDLGPPRVTIGKHQKALFLVRDPRDVAISFYYHVKHRASDRELLRKKIPATMREVDINEFVLNPHCGVPRVIRHFNRWATERREIDLCDLVRFEDLKSDPVRELALIAHFVGLAPSAQLIAEVADFGSFNNLKQKEQSGFFQSDRLGLTDPHQEDSAKVRKGEVGSYRHELTPETVATVDSIVSSELDACYGYV